MQKQVKNSEWECWTNTKNESNHFCSVLEKENQWNTSERDARERKSEREWGENEVKNTQSFRQNEKKWDKKSHTYTERDTHD